MPNAISQSAYLAGAYAGTTGAYYKSIGRHKTKVFAYSGNVTRVVYHDTPIVSFNESSIELNTGGWWTRTTKVRMNQTSQEFGLGYAVFQKDHEWFVDYRGEVHPFTSEELTLSRDNQTQKGGEQDGN